MFYIMWTTECFIGMALEVCAAVRSVKTFVSLEFEQIETKAFLTSSEMKEFASRAFLISLLKIKSKSESKLLFTLWES